MLLLGLCLVYCHLRLGRALLLIVLLLECCWGLLSCCFGAHWQLQQRAGEHHLGCQQQGCLHSGPNTETTLARCGLM